MSQKKFSSDMDISRYDLEWNQGIATGRSRLVSQGDSLPDYYVLPDAFHRFAGHC